MADHVSVALVGASGYTGAEALRLIRQHPHVHLALLCAGRQAGKALSEVMPAFHGVQMPDLVPFDADQVASEADFAILAVPHGTAQEAARALLDRGVRVIDLSADHRFSDADLFAEVYGPHAHPESLAQTVYGVPELNRDAIATAELVGCAGCYPTSVILGAMPAVRAGLLSAGAQIIADCKSGVTGAGRNPTANTHFPETSEGIKAYKTLSHRHAPEMGMILGHTVRFVPHLVPMSRGILSTLYLPLQDGISEEQIRAIYDEAYGDEPFVTVLPEGHHPETRHVRGSNRCHIGLFPQGDLLVVQSVIDNLVKGAAGQGLQCLNLMAGRPETEGLEHTALFP
ncbi:MAG: N-acetyl-gamma-glutamyl-phosphate reductase [Bradymonadia bacterium]